jgi:signal transduction histidine kinase
MESRPDAPRALRLGGLLVWLMVGIPTALQGTGRLEAFVVWVGGFVLFGALFAATTASGRSHPPPVRTAALLAQAGAVVVMTAVQCRGYEGTLLVLVAMQVGWWMPQRAGLVWVALQTIALAWGIQHHWSLRQALLLAPPYLGFQVLGLLAMGALAREVRAAGELASTNAELLATRELLAQTARVNERLRIAGELHDAMGHSLAALSLNLEALAQAHEVPPAPLETARALTRRVLDDVESVVDSLARHGSVDLVQALDALASAIPRPLVHVEAPGLVLTDPERAHTLLRCCQEIVTNSVKHSQAANLWITIRMADGVVELDARDDGAGAARVAAGRGLQGMRRRLEDIGGALETETRPGGGFQLRATLPVGTSG